MKINNPTKFTAIVTSEGLESLERAEIVSGGLEVVYLWRFESAFSWRFLALTLK